MINIWKDTYSFIFYRKDLTFTKVNGPNCLQTTKNNHWKKLQKHHKPNTLVFRIRFGFNADPDPVFYLNADPGAAFYLNADPDPVFYLNVDPDLAFYLNADPYLAFYLNTDP